MFLEPGTGVVEEVSRKGRKPGCWVVAVSVERRCGVKPGGERVVVIRVDKR